MHLSLTLSLLTLLLPHTHTHTQSTTPSQNPNSTTPYPSRHIITLAQAMTVIDAATTAAQSTNPASNIAVTDPSGFLVAFHRLENAFLASIDISVKKAKTVALFNGMYTTEGFYNASQPGGSLYGIEETNQVLVVFGGGLPIFVDGYFIGAIGVSGGTVGQDIEIANAGVRAVGNLTATGT